MSKRAAAFATIAVMNGVDGPCGVVFADSPERLWAEMQVALRRARDARPPLSAIAGPVDFAAAMRRVEDEVYDAA
jgi:hypothetical protein